MMNLDIEYRLKGQSESLHTNKTNDDLEVAVTDDGDRHIVAVIAKKDIVLIKGRVNNVHTLEKDDVFPTNGYQSWTDTAERTLRENKKEKNVKKLPKFLVNMYAFDKYGDATFFDYKSYLLHGYNIFYVKGKKELFSFNCNFKTAYLIYEINKKNRQLSVISDVYNIALKAGEKVNVCDVYFAFNYQKGLEEFNNYFTPRKAEKVFGYTSWYNYYQNINESIILRDLEALDKRFNLFQIDDGYETFIGDWLDVDEKKFPNGLKPIVDKIHEKGYKAGIWLAPFVAETNSKVFKEHQDWIKRTENGELAKCGSNWSGFYALNLDIPEVREYIKKCLTNYVELGFDFFKLDFLYGSMEALSEGKSRAMMSDESYQLLRDILGDKLILGCGANCFSSYQKFEYLRVGPDVSLLFDDIWYMKYMHRERVSTKVTVQNTIYRHIFNNNLFLNDPDVFLLRKDNIQLSDEQKESLLTINALFGSVLMTSDDIATYDEHAKALLEEKLNLFYNAKDVGFKKDGKFIDIYYTLEGKNYTLRYNTQKGTFNNAR